MSNALKFNSKLENVNIDDSDFEDSTDSSEMFDTPIIQENDTIEEKTDDFPSTENQEDIEDDEKQSDIKNVFTADFSEEDENYEKKLNRLQCEYIRDVTVTISNFKEKALNEAFVRGKWCSLLFSEKHHLANLREAEERLTQELSDMVAEKRKNSSFLTEKMSLSKVMENDKSLKMLRTRIKHAAEIESFLTSVYNDIKNFSYSIKNVTEAMKLEMGL